MKDTANLHQKVQELCDCFATTDPLKQMSMISRSQDAEEELKWIALAILHGINSNASKISLVAEKDGTVIVTAKYREAELPSPGPEIGRKIIEAMRTMTHLEKDKQKTAFAFGIRNNSMDLEIKARKKDGGEKVTIVFPEP